MSHGVGLARQEVVVVINKTAGTSKGIGDTCLTAGIIIDSRDLESEGRQYGLYLITVFVIVKLCLDTHGVCHFRNQSLAVDGETFSNLFWSRHINQVAFGIVTVSCFIAHRIGDAGQVVHLVVGHLGDLIPPIIGNYPYIYYVTFRVVVNAADICIVALEGLGQFWMILYAIGDIYKQTFSASYTCRHIVFIVSIVI